MDIFDVHQAKGNALPILISIPHAGTYIPPSIEQQLKPHLLPADDTDWFVGQLYAFATAMGITIIQANYSRWVIDLNRDPESKPLYNDGRIITALCPTTDFLGKPIYINERQQVSQPEVEERVKLYFEPYHQKIQSLLDGLKTNFGQVLLWDAHSIRKNVASIYPKNFPDLILGDADKTTASKPLINITMDHLLASDYTVSHNHPFKGGFITRHFGRPEKQQHALQLEMTKPNYMDDAEINYDKKRAGKMQQFLKGTLLALLKQLSSPS